MEVVFEKNAKCSLCGIKKCLKYKFQCGDIVCSSCSIKHNAECKECKERISKRNDKPRSAYFVEQPSGDVC